MKKLLSATVLMMMAGLVNVASAKLPPLSDEAKAKAEEAKAKADHGNKVAAYQLCLSQDKVAAGYRKEKGASAKPATETPACVNPGPFVPPTAAATAAPATAAAATTAAAAPAAPAKK